MKYQKSDEQVVEGEDLPNWQHRSQVFRISMRGVYKTEEKLGIKIGQYFCFSVALTLPIQLFNVEMRTSIKIFCRQTPIEALFDVLQAFIALFLDFGRDRCRKHLVYLLHRSQKQFFLVCLVRTRDE